MPLKVYPAINCDHKDLETAKEKARCIETFAAVAHVDVADGRFTFNKSWGSPEELAGLSTALKYEVHLMAEDPELVVKEWCTPCVSRIIVHAEALIDQSYRRESRIPADIAKEIIDICHANNIETFLAINPETPLDAVESFVSLFDGYQIFSQAHPGPSGQVFLPSVLPKITALRQKFPHATIEVDGGITMETALLVKGAGADAVVSGTLVLGASDPKIAYEQLMQM